MSKGQDTCEISNQRQYGLWANGFQTGCGDQQNTLKKDINCAMHTSYHVRWLLNEAHYSHVEYRTKKTFKNNNNPKQNKSQFAVLIITGTDYVSI